MRSPIIFRVFKDSQLVGVKQFDQDQIVIGQGADVHLDLQGDGVSPIHCMVEFRDGVHYVADLGSQAGTFKNGQAVLDEAIASGDEIFVGPFKISFFVGVPKPKTVPTDTVAAAASVVTPPPPPSIPVSVPNMVAHVPPTIPAAAPEQMTSDTAVAVVAESTKVQAPIETKSQEEVVAAVIPVQAPKVEEKPTLPEKPRPQIKSTKSPFKKDKKNKSFAPPSDIQDLRRHLKPGKGPIVEVIMAWKERVITTSTFKGSQSVRVNTGAARQLALPDGLAPKGFAMIDLAGGMRVNTTGDMKIEMISALGNQSAEELVSSGKAVKSGTGYSVKVEQSEMVCVTLPQGNITLYIRFGPPSPIVPMIPMMLSGSEMTGLVMSLVLVALLALYISATTPKDWEENKQEEVQRVAQVIFNNPPKPPPPPPPQVVETPPPTVTKPPEPPKKVIVADRAKDAQTKGVKPEKSARAEKAGQAAEVAPKPNSKNRPKTFTSTKQGGAVKMGKTAGANAQSANKDMSKVGLFSAFGGGGNRANIDKAYSGSGEVLGMADKATGTSGFNEDRAGDDLGSKFKDSGAGGKGTATQGIAGVGTKGRGSGQSAYGAADGYGSKNSVAIEGGGFEESFDGTIDKEAIRRVIRAKKHELQSCYERALNTLSKGQKLEGKIVLSWEIIKEGQARNVKIKSSSLGNRQVENCIRDRLASWTFPEPPPGLVAEVQAYPFVLNQSN